MNPRLPASLLPGEQHSQLLARYLSFPQAQSPDPNSPLLHPTHPWSAEARVSIPRPHQRTLHSPRALRGRGPPVPGAGPVRGRDRWVCRGAGTGDCAGSGGRRAPGDASLWAESEGERARGREGRGAGGPERACDGERHGEWSRALPSGET